MPSPARLAFGALALVAIERQLAVHLALGLDVINFFSYFTNLSNLMAAVILLMGGSPTRASRAASEPFDTLRTIAAVNMVIVGVVFTALLRGTDLGALLPWVNVVVHYIMPVAVLIDWLLAPPARRLGRRVWWWCLPMPLVYLVYVLARGAATGWYPYPFLRPAAAGGYSGVALYVAAIVVLYLVASAALIAVANRTRRAASLRSPLV